MLLSNDPAHAFMPYPAVPVPHADAGPLAGLDFAVKDLFDVAGYPTSAGSPTVLALSGVKRHTAPTVQHLLDAGARFVGKTVTDELAFSMIGQNAHFGTPRNGGAPDRVPGGSSSGSASAVSNHLCDFALGTDTGGSVRAPASHCGLLGLRPSHGRISLAGCFPLSATFDTCGFFARDIGTFARVADVLLGQDVAALPSRVRLLLASDLFGRLAPAPAQALQPALARLQQAFGDPVSVSAVGDQSEADRLYWAYRYTQGHEAWTSDGDLICRYRPALGPGVAERFEWCSQVSTQQLQPALATREEFRQRLGRLLGSDGVLVMPTMPDAAPLLGEPEARLDVYRNQALHLTCPAGMAGFPQLTLPLAQRDGAPYGLSLLGPPGRDRSLVRLAQTLLDMNSQSANG